MTQALARAHDPITSIEAGERVKSFIKDHEQIIINHLKANGASTTKDIARSVGTNHERFSRRMRELARRKVVQEVLDPFGSAEKRDGCTVWRLING